MKDASNLQKLVITAMMAAITCVLGPLAMPIPFTPVPISLTQIPIFLAVYVLGWKYGTLSFVIYYLIGLAGLPVFSGFSGGFGKAMGPTGGYLIGFALMAAVAGFIIEKSGGKRWLCILGMVLGDFFAYLFGTPWLCYQLNISFLQGLSVGVFPYLIGDAVKTIACSVLGPILQNALRKIRH